MRKRQQIITSIVMGSAVAALAVNSASAAENTPKMSKQDPNFDLLAQSPPPPPAPSPQPLIPNPKVTIDGIPTNNGAVLPPTMPRAVAPPVGDISISNLDGSLANSSVNLGTNKIIPNLVLKDAPIREVLEVLVKSAGLNLAYVADNPDDKNNQTAPTKKVEPKITVNFQRETVQNAFNFVLKISGFESVRVGNTVFVGAKLPDSIQENIVRVIRLNQVSATAAAGYLAAQGAEARVPQETTKVESLTVGKVEQTITKKSVEVATTNVQTANAPVLLRGLAVNVDERLNSITVIGTSRKVALATSLITRLDARRRQVALNVKIVDVNLSNTDRINSSLSFGVGDSFLSVDNGAALYNYGGYNPATPAQTLASPTTPPIVSLRPPGGSQVFLDSQPNAPFNSANARPGFGTTANPYLPGIISNENGRITYAVPTNYQVPTKFLSNLQAQIISGNGKILTDPTLVIQEGQKSTVNLTQEVFGGFETISSAGTGATITTRKPIIKNAGLKLDLLVNRIDDNGYISVAVSPTVSSIGSTLTTADGDISLVQERTMNSGDIRLRDGQPLILSGIIQESDRASVTKVPILGDLPLLGSLFRSTTKTNQRQEVVVLLTPQILDDSRSTVNYTPGVDARLMLGK